MTEPIAETGDTAQLSESVELTIMFCSIAKFMALAERLQSEPLVKLLNEHLAVVTETILAHKGLIDKFMGDTVLACWGADSNATLQACLCALEIVRRIETMSGTTAERHSVRIGINTGKLVKAVVGTVDLKDYTVIGDAVNIAHAIGEAGKDYNTSILISKSTFDNVRESVTVREIGDVTLGSRVTPINLYELIGSAPNRSR